MNLCVWVQRGGDVEWTTKTGNGQEMMWRRNDEGITERNREGI